MRTKLQLWSTCLGNLFEHYDTALFGFLSPFLAPLLFPQKDPLTALILTYAIIPLGMLARPIGSLLFGHIGDVYGRSRALLWALGGMSLVSAAIALSPTYAQVGIWAPLFFCVGRILQNFFASGEIMGGSVFLLENSPQTKHDFLSGLFESSTIGGILLASFGVSLFCHFEAIDFGWRLLYLIGCITGVFGWLIRLRFPKDLPAKTGTSLSEGLSQGAKVFWTYRKPLLLIACSAGFSYANYSMALVFINGFVPMISSITKEQMIAINTSLLLLDFCALPFFGWLASKVSREKTMLAAALGVVFTALPCFLLLQEATFLRVISIRIWFVLLGVAFCAPFHAWAQTQVPTAHRYAVLSFGYAIGSQVLGGPFSAISLWTYQQTGSISSACWYWLLLAVVAGLAIRRSCGNLGHNLDHKLSTD